MTHPPTSQNAMDDLVLRLSERNHSVEASIRPERTVEGFKAAIDRDYVHIKFTETRGGTELGVQLDRDACRFDEADFDAATGTVHIEGDLRLNYVPVRCIADIDLATLDGTGRLVVLEEVA